MLVQKVHGNSMSTLKESLWRNTTSYNGCKYIDNNKYAYIKLFNVYHDNYNRKSTARKGEPWNDFVQGAAHK